MSQFIPFDTYGDHGPLLHFAHANAYPPGAYSQLLRRLSSKFRVVAIHHRPLWPGSRPQEIDRWDALADDMVHFFDQKGLTKVVGVGHSLGAVTTMMAALKRPELFRALVLVEPVFLDPAILKLVAHLPDSSEIYELPFIKIAQKRRNHWVSRQEAFEHFRPKRVFSRLTDEALWDYVNFGLKEDDDGGLTLSYDPRWEVRIYGFPPTEVWESIPKIKHPTLALRGTESDTLLPAAWEIWYQQQPQATFVEILDSGHLLPMEKPSEIAKYIEQFVSGLVGEQSS